jgi:dephospho-CoA kinase
MIIGITGGIGSGKSTVAKIFATLGIPIYDADAAAKKIMQNNDELKKELKKQFGEATYTSEGLDRKYLANIVFTDKDKLEILNSLVHPYTLADADNWAKQQTSPYVIKEAALMFESRAAHHVDYIIGVSAPKALRIQRVMYRDGLTRDEVIARMNRQIEENIKMKLCDFVIINDEQQLIIPQVVSLHQQFLHLSK